MPHCSEIDVRREHFAVSVDARNELTEGVHDPIGPSSIPWNLLSSAAESCEYASDLTHPLYRYPGRMSPHLARALIVGLTEPGDIVLDPFSGGGTTAVEALSNGRRAICCDLNALACFVTRAKAWPVRKQSLAIYRRWAASTVSGVQDSTYPSLPLLTSDGSGYAPRTHALLLHLRDEALGVKDPSSRRLALLTVLRVGQLCFDCRQTPPSPKALRNLFESVAQMVLNRVELYASACRQHRWPGGLRRSLQVFRGDAKDLPERLGALRMRPLSLILTSPPYPGVHVLYHRWQIYGRRETALPYNLLYLNDGFFESHYTFGSRKQPGKLYFASLEAVFASLHRLTTPLTLVAQVVGFADPQRHLPRFRDVMAAAGFDEVIDPDSPDSAIGRLVPHRRWYAELSIGQGSGHEFLLIHRPRRSGGKQRDRGTARSSGKQTKRG